MPGTNLGLLSVSVIFALIVSYFMDPEQYMFGGVIPCDSINVQKYLTNIYDVDKFGSLSQYQMDSFADTSGFVFRADFYNINNPLKRTAIRILNYGWKLPHGWEYTDSVDGQEIQIPVTFIHRESLAARLIEKDARYYLKVALQKKHQIP